MAPPSLTTVSSGQGIDLAEAQLAQIRATTDRLFAWLLLAEWLAGVGMALSVSPLAWAGTANQIHFHVLVSLLLGSLIVCWPVTLALTRPGRTVTRHVIAIAQMLMAALFIHLAAGRIETHFMTFASLAFLASYRDWKVLISATLVVLLDRFVRGLYFPLSVFGLLRPSLWRWLEHGMWVAVEDLFLIYAIYRGNRVQAKVASEKLVEIDQYVLKEKLGGGGMGEVFLAEHRLLKRPCAIKLIRPELAKDPAILARFEREVRTTAQLRHPNTVGIYDFGHLEDGTFFYVMEYLPGLTLQQLVEKYGPLPPGRVVYLAQQICEALSEAHSIGLIHRDIKPGNILLCDLGGQHDIAKLFDFGLVRKVEEDGQASKLTQAGLILGTPRYMSPEQVTGEEIDQRSDLFSLGAVAFFLLTGQAPFEGPNALAVMYARIKDPVRAPSQLCPDMPQDLDQIVVRCLARDKSKRFWTLVGHATPVWGPEWL